MSKIIKGWEDLVGLESENYKLEIDLKYGNGWIRPKVITEETEMNYLHHNRYLSTHTFYESKYLESTEMLQEFGFDVVLESWG